MKLDIDYIEKILRAVEAHSEMTIFQEELLFTIGSDAENDPAAFKKFYHHMMRIDEAGFLMCHDSSGFGFVRTSEGTHLLDMDYELTLDGHKYLEAIGNDTIGAKAKQMFTDMSITQFKQKFPALILAFFGM